MASLITGPAQQRWARELFARGLQEAVNAAWQRQAPLARAYQWFAKLEEAGVLRQWQIVTGEDIYDLEDPGSGAPLFLAGPRWDAFAGEAAARGLVAPEEAR